MAIFQPINEVSEARAKRKARAAFYTPLAVVEKLMEWADIYPSAVCLEPSAGDGRIVHALKQCGVARVDCCEKERSLHPRIVAIGGEMVGIDFLKYQAASPIYDRIVMNPPFRRGEAIKHIEHAWEFLQPTGILVSLATPTVGDKLGRCELDLPGCEFATYESLGKDLFQEYGTSIEVGLVTLQGHQEPQGLEIDLHLGYSNGATCNAVLTIQTCEELVNHWRGDIEVALLKAGTMKAIAASGGSCYGIDWEEVRLEFRGG